MSKKTRLGVTVLAIIALLTSFGLDWFYLRRGPDMSFVGNSAVTVTAGEGSLRIAGLKLEIWLAIAIAIIGAGLGPFATGPSAPLPRFVPLIALGVAAAYTGAGLLGVSLYAPDRPTSPFDVTSARLGPGPLAAVVGIAAWVVTVLAPSNKVAT